MRTLDATAATPLSLLRELLGGLTEHGVVLVHHGDDISERRLRAAMASLARGLGLQFRQATGQALRPNGFAPPAAVVVFGVQRGAPGAFAGRDPRQFQTVWVRPERASDLLDLHGQPGVLTLALGPGPAVPLADWLQGAP